MAQMSETARALTRKYNYTPFMYIDYPHKSYWSRDFGDREAKAALDSLFVAGQSVPTAFYVHMPYCQKQCLFCTCHVLISNEYEDVKHYLTYLYKEIDLLKRFFDERGVKPQITDIHLGGGSPTFIQEKEFDALIAKIETLVPIKDVSEFTIEIDPRRVKQDRVKYYHSKGINRISFGVQDFDLEVQKAVNRVQPAELTARLLTPEIRSLFKNGVNFDILCGLPYQTKESVRETFKKVVELSPDRICLNYMDFAPKFAQHQLLMPKEALPGIEQKKELFLEALEILSNSSYVRTGYDHFAKRDDDVAKAMDAKKMVWNQLGYTPGRSVDVLAVGVSGSNRIGAYYYQNVYDLGEYEKLVDAGKLPVTRGIKLGQDDIIRRDVIHQLRGYFTVDFAEMDRRYGIHFARYFQVELSRMGEFVADGIATVSDKGIYITDEGQQFANLVCENFDKYLDATRFTRRDDEVISQADRVVARLPVLG